MKVYQILALTKGNKNKASANWRIQPRFNYFPLVDACPSFGRNVLAYRQAESFGLRKYWEDDRGDERGFGIKKAPVPVGRALASYGG